jgi:hypothetical protein
MERALIVARIRDGAEGDVARIFADSDATDLPRLVGVRRRSLFVRDSLYMHLIDLDDDATTALRRAQELPQFKEISARLRPFVEAYDPATWRSPQDALAREFYRWEAPDLR